ncbi:carbohydrate binding domain-containing protein [Flavobacterium piscinae]|uniref:carbohydrate binding domain-containing protein n=1 Tax=Flavobacterium piscinae TaxID=2506424 RepID=UPI001987BF54|nr:carbohydrate binding domain-containing protein [Flavobacterium piscinae]MBC8884332.1 carbohydrate binding domain-containing protein [Flavobacterium piscinae]
MTSFILLLIATFGFAQNLITNGDFESGTAGWSGNALNVVTEGDNSYNAANVTTAGNAFDVNLSYVYPMTTMGTSYKLTFTGFSDGDRTMVVGVGLNEAPWTAVTQIVDLNNGPQTFVLILTTNFASANSRIIFDMGADTGFVGIDDVMLEITTTTCNNGIQDGDETGIDCGGSCPDCLTLPPTAAQHHLRDLFADVVSIFSDAYTNIGFDNFDAGWCGGVCNHINHY